MKKPTKLIALLIIVVMILSAVSGCTLVTVNSDRDGKQVIATVKTGDDVAADEILKSDLSSAFMSNYSTYAQYISYGYYTYESLYKQLLESLISKRITLQQGRRDLSKAFTEGKYDAPNTNYPTLSIDSPIEAFISDLECAKAEYQVKKSINGLIDSYVETDVEEEEKPTVTVRATPTVEEKDEELTIAEYNDYKIDTDSTTERKTSYNLVVRVLTNYGLISSDFDVLTDDISQSEYYSKMIKSYKEQAFVNAYKEYLTDKLTDEVVNSTSTPNEAFYNLYESLWDSEKESFEYNYSLYETALSATNTDSTKFVPYNPYEGYGFVYNLLVKFSTEQSALLTAYKTANPNATKEELRDYRNTLCRQITVNDLRSTWVTEGYMNDTHDGFDERYSKYVDFEGTFSYDEEKETYSVSDVKEFGIDEFLGYVENLLGVQKDASVSSSTFYSTGKITGETDAYALSDEKNAIAKELLYAFSEDGETSLKNIYGYMITPTSTMDDYVAEFSETAKYLVQQGAGSYAVVATDYGYHILICSKVVKTDTQKLSQEQFLADADTEGTFAYEFKKAKLDTIVADKITDYVAEYVANFRDDETSVVTYLARYEDLWAGLDK